MYIIYDIMYISYKYMMDNIILCHIHKYYTYEILVYIFQYIDIW